MARREIRAQREAAVQLKSRSAHQQQKISAMNHAFGRPIMPETVAQLQQLHGNQAVQQFLRRQREEEEHGAHPAPHQRPEVKESEAIAYRSEYRMRTKATLSPSGGLMLDLNHPIHLERYSDKSRAMRHIISQWQGRGRVDLDDQRYVDKEVYMRSDDGRCRLDLGQPFLDQLSQAQNPESQEERAALDFNRPFDVDLKASLHYRSNDARLQENDLELPDSLTDLNQSHDGLFLKIELSAVYINRIDGKPERRELSGMLILQGIGDQP